MTAIYYPDCRAVSPSGRFILEARSPHNGTISHQDGRSATEEEFGFKYRERQSNFRYQLLDNAGPSESGGRVVWERWQAEDEDSPHELIVSDEGWTVIRTHGFKPEVITASPEGQVTVRVRICGQSERRPEKKTEKQVCWAAERLALWTAGSYWAGHSWPYFFDLNGIPYFVWRTYWGTRLVIELNGGVLVAESGPDDDPLRRAMNGEEARGSHELLSGLSNEFDKVLWLFENRHSDPEACKCHPLWKKLRGVTAAIHLTGVHRVAESVPLLRSWEAIDYPSYVTGSAAMGSGWVQGQYFRPILHHTLKLFGEEPKGYPAYHFSDADHQPVARPDLVPRCIEKAGDLSIDMSAVQVLQLLGSPDHIRRRSHPVGTLHRWTEEWEYDFRRELAWTTMRITWEEHRRNGRITAIEDVTPYWLETDQRVLEILQD